MDDNYTKIVKDKLSTLFQQDIADTAAHLPGTRVGEGVAFQAFGEVCRILPGGIRLGSEIQEGPLGIIIALYALNANPAEMILEPFRAFKEFSGTAPYHGAFANHTERILVPGVHRIKTNIRTITEKLQGMAAPASVGGDFAFVVHPFPKIALCYIFYEADEEFPASVTCLFSSNANRFMPNDGLADTGEYTSRKILKLL